MVIHRVIPFILRNKVEVKQMTSFLFFRHGWGGKAFSGKVIFADKALVNTRDTCTTINEHSGVDSFQGV
jgi:hypothetical protein